MTYLNWLFSAENWSGSAGIAQRLVEHLGYTALSLVVALVIALPLGAWVGHTGRGGFLIVGVANAMRALPTLGLLVLLFLAAGYGLLGPVITLVILAVPPLLAGAYSGVANVDSSIVDAAKGMGMRGREILFKVELPNALPLILGGVRSATLQVIATATIAAYVGLGGLGRFVLDGLSTRDFPQMFGGAIVLALLAVVAEVIFGGLQKLIVSPGLQERAAQAGPQRLRLIRGGADTDRARAA